MRRSRFCLVLLLVVVASGAGFATPARASIPYRYHFYVELFGSSILYSVNFEFLPVKYVGMRVGYELMHHGDHNDFLVPLTASLLFTYQNIQYEFGGGLLYGSVIGAVTDSGAEVGWTGIIGIRFFPRDHMVLRIIWTPLVLEDAFLPFFLGVSLGLSF